MLGINPLTSPAARPKTGNTGFKGTAIVANEYLDDARGLLLGQMLEQPNSEDPENKTDILCNTNDDINNDDLVTRYKRYHNLTEESLDFIHDRSAAFKREDCDQTWAPSKQSLPNYHTRSTFPRRKNG